ncbi:MAG: family 10 glycosylhydrolase [Clostridia bacterium]|nr:family 10 glycosylhydrolase [Clostridia bacterium]
MKKSKFFRAAFFSLTFLTLVILACKYIKTLKTSYTVPSFSQNETQNTENSYMIGVWIPYLDLNINDSENTEEKFKNKFDEIIKVSKENKANTLIVHVRSHGDAMYKSKYFPWSHILTGTQGQDPGFDPLEYMVKTCHENNLKIHAWVNPLRIKLPSNPNELCSSNPYFKLSKEKYFIKNKGSLYYNPSYPEVRELIVNGIKEIVQNYNVDAIHIDDYFYPEGDCEILEQFDGITKKEAINLLIKEIYSAVKNEKPIVQFGISPPGNLKKCDLVGADIKTWVENSGFVDYICPQIYWSTDFDEMPFEATAKNWKELFKSNNNTKLYCGLALYKAGSDLADKGTWKSKNNILSKEFKICKNLGFNGIMIYSWSFLKSECAKAELENLLNELK